MQPMLCATFHHKTYTITFCQDICSYAYESITKYIYTYEQVRTYVLFAIVAMLKSIMLLNLPIILSRNSF